MIDSKTAWKCVIELKQSWERDVYDLTFRVEDTHGVIRHDLKCTASSLEEVALLKSMFEQAGEEVIRYLTDKRLENRDPAVALRKMLAEAHERRQKSLERGYNPRDWDDDI